MLSSCDITEVAPESSINWLGELMGDSSRGVVTVTRPGKEDNKLLVVPAVVVTGESWTRGPIAPSVVGPGNGTDTGVVGDGGPECVDGAVVDTGVVGGGPRGGDGTDTGVLGGDGGPDTGAGDGTIGFSGVSPITPLQNSFLPN